MEGGVEEKGEKKDGGNVSKQFARDLSHKGNTPVEQRESSQETMRTTGKVGGEVGRCRWRFWTALWRELFACSPAFYLVQHAVTEDRYSSVTLSNSYRKR